MTEGGWRGGDYTTAGDAWAHAADDVAARALAGLGPVRGATAPHVLDVGTGSGPAVLAAVRAGAHAVGVDLEPGLLRIAESRARQSGAGAGSARFVAGDAQALPFVTDAFDIVLSTFGVMFAPEPSQAASELVRVCRPGGLIAVASWTPDGIMGRIAPTARRHLGHRPHAADPGMRWGDPAQVRSWFAPLPVTVRTQVERVRVRFPSVRHAVAAFENKPGPLREHRAALETMGLWQSARADLADLFAAHNRVTDGELVFDAPYLLVLGRVGAGEVRPFVRT
ncbi:class I SAM-dependent methyltransferase [Streptomyces sp. NPDC004609]|uniref:class I SAM-dependent methyltransferase n=1 Tax=Streptomyces sp. NPDC004609 TaxID=3364704 RepID=UPI0036A688D5